MFAVIVRFSLRPDAMKGAQEAVRRLLPLMRAEGGVVSFEALASDGGVLVFDERWDDRPAWERHLAARPAPVAEIAREIAAGFAAPPQVDTYEVLS